MLCERGLFTEYICCIYSTVRVPSIPGELESQKLMLGGGRYTVSGNPNIHSDMKDKGEGEGGRGLYKWWPSDGT